MSNWKWDEESVVGKLNEFIEVATMTIYLRFGN
jgi:hypothetical protein